MRIRLFKLLLAMAALGLVWLIVLPMAAARPAVAEHIRLMKAKGVDPSAMYYTELDMMEPIFDRMALEKRKSPAF